MAVAGFPGSSASHGPAAGGGGSGGSGRGRGGGGGGGGCTNVQPTPAASGSVDAARRNLGGAWFAYGDSRGATGSPPGNCEAKGTHPWSACSSITSPPAAPTDG